MVYYFPFLSFLAYGSTKEFLASRRKGKYLSRNYKVENLPSYNLEELVLLRGIKYEFIQMYFLKVNLYLYYFIYHANKTTAFYGALSTSEERKQA